MGAAPRRPHLLRRRAARAAPARLVRAGTSRKRYAGHVWRPLRRSDAADLVKAAAKLAGLPCGPENRWAAHSLKGGGATWYRAAGYDEDYLIMLFRWSTPAKKMVRYYARASLELLSVLRDQNKVEHARLWNLDVTVPRRFGSA